MKKFIIAALTVSLLLAQNSMVRTGQSGAVDLSSSSAITLKGGTSLPGTCTTKDIFIKTDASAALVIYICTATNTWTQQSGTGDAFFAVSGPASTVKTFTFPNASATVLTDNALVTAAQGGTANGFFQVSGPASTTKTYTFPNANATIPQTIATGTAALGTSAISGNACATAVTTSATGVLTTDIISYTPNADISGITGYGVASTDGLIIYPYPTADNVNFKVCNSTGTSITPGAVTLNFRVTR